MGSLTRNVSVQGQHSPFSWDLLQLNKNMALLRGHTRVHILASLRALLAFEYEFYDFYG